MEFYGMRLLVAVTLAFVLYLRQDAVARVFAHVADDVLVKLLLLLHEFYAKG